jgi:uncharacterized delta-60 repeat protein
MWDASTEESGVSLRAPGVVAVTQPYALEDFGETPVFTVGGTVTGLEGEGLELTDFATFLTVHPANGPFTFSQPRPSGSSYDVRITSPASNPMQVCSISNARGTVGAANVTDIAIQCVTPAPEPGLDLTFGSAGKLVAQHEGAAAIALQADDSIVLVGGLTLTRYTGDGGVDSSFGSGGAAGVVFGSSSYSAARALAIQPDDGKIVVAGYTTADTQGTQYEFAVARYTVEGAADLDFNGGAAVTTGFVGGYGQAYSVLIQSDGRIVVAGPASSEAPRLGFGVARYTADGAPDPYFGSGGKVTTSIADGPVTAAAAVLQTDGKIVVTGPVFGPDGRYQAFYLVRYTTDGALDSEFGDGGLVRADFGLSDVDVYPTGLVLQSPDKILVVGQVGGTFAVARLDGAGRPDSEFGSAGLVTTSFDGYAAYAQGAAIQTDGKIVVAGYTGEVSNEDFAVARYSTEGVLDGDFGSGGKLTIDFFDASNRATCIAIQRSGKILIAGSAWQGSRLSMARILP